MLITNLTATENNGVVTAEFEWGNMTVKKLEVNLDVLVDNYVTENFDFSVIILSEQDMQEIRRNAEAYVKRKLATVVTQFINHNLH